MDPGRPRKGREATGERRGGEFFSLFSLSGEIRFPMVFLRPEEGKILGNMRENRWKTAIKSRPEFSERILLRFLYRKAHTFSSGGWNLASQSHRFL